MPLSGLSGGSGSSGGGGNVTVVGPLGQTTKAASIPVTIASDQGAQAVTATDGALVTVGTTTDAAVVTAVAGTLMGYLRALKEAFLSRIPILGQSTKAGSIPVTIASDQGNLGATVSNFPATQPVTLPAAQVDANNNTRVTEAAAINSAFAQQTSTAAAAALVIARVTRKRCLIYNGDAANSVWVGQATVTTANGFILKAGQSMEYRGAGLLQIIDNGSHAVVYVEDDYD